MGHISETAKPPGRPRRKLGWVALGVAIVAGLLLLSSLLVDSPRPLKPLLRPETTVVQTSGGNSAPISVSFAELIADPYALQNRRIRVTGRYTPHELPICQNWKGPAIQYALVADDLQLEAVGFEGVLSLVAAGTTLTVDGIWRLYQGPYGCGKEPPTNNTWFLEVELIVAPNPLLPTRFPSQTEAAVPTDAATIGSEATPIPTVEETSPGANVTATPPGPSATPDPLRTATATIPSTVTATPRLGATATATRPGGNATPTLSSQSQTATAAPTSAFTPKPTMTGTPLPGSTATPGPSPTAMPTRTPLPTLPPFTTATPGGPYPGPDATATVTPTLEPYP